MEVAQDGGTTSARHALLALAARDSNRGQRQLIQHEVTTAEQCLAVIQHSPNFHDICIEVVLEALKHANHELIRLVFAKIDHLPNIFQDQTSIVLDVIQYDPGYRRFEGTDILSFVIHHGAPAETCNEDGKTAFQLICEAGYYDPFQLLLTAGADPKQPLSIPPSECQTTNLLEWTLSTLRKADPYFDVPSYWDQDLSVGHGYIIMHLQRLGLDVDPSNRDLIQFFWMLCYQGDLESAKQVYQAGAGVDLAPLEDMTEARYSFGSAMHAAVDGGRVHIVQFLLDIGVRPSLKAYCGSKDYGRMTTPILYAINHSLSHKDSYDACELLVDAGAESEDRRALLEQCVRREWVDRTKRLLDRGIRLNEVPIGRSGEIVRLLYDTGAHLNGPKLMEFALGSGIREAHGRPPPLDLVKYLHEEHGMIFERENFAQTVQSLLWGDSPSKLTEQHLGILDYILDAVGWEFGKGAALPKLLQAGATVDSPGLPESTLLFYARESQGLHRSFQGEEHHFRLLMQYSNEEVIQDFRSSFADQLLRFQETLVELKDACKIYEVQAAGSKPHNTATVRQPSSTNPISELLKANNYLYAPLQGPRTVRLFNIAPSAFLDDPIAGVLEHFELFQIPPFEALSYVWGDSTDLLPIQVNERPMHITAALHAALRRLRKPDQSRSLWIDSICINQSDNKEKGRQVGIMGDIYTAAERTLSWVGEHENASHVMGDRLRARAKRRDDSDYDRPDTSYVLEDVPDHVSDPPDECGEDHVNSDCSTNDLVDPIDAFMRRPYFYRTWVLQEIALSQSAVILCGPDAYSFEDVADMPGYGYEEESFHPFRGRRGASQLQGIQALARSNNPRREIHSAIRVSRYCAASDPKDKVYGIFGLLNQQPLPVDYERPVEDIYRDFTKAIIAKEGNIKVLHWLGTARSSLSRLLPSWVPDWSTSAPTGCLPRSISGGAYPSGTPLRHTDSLRFSGNDMILHGKAFATIEAVGEVPAVESGYEPGSTKFFDVLRSWEACALPTVAERGIDGLEAFATTLNAQDQYCPGQRSLLSDYIIWSLNFGHRFLRTALPQLFEKVELMMAALPDFYNKDHMKLTYPRYAEKIEYVCYGRRFFVTTDGTMGLAPPRAQAGDSLVLFPGGIYPFVVRPLDGGKHELIGDCFLEGLDIKDLFREGSEIPIEEFVLC
ncbi:hypothetical protein PRZ48_000626 [Zasmidium cellare]|uniref:Heterokaryon incompatibility domain-containing protein n=1 Tax=Zasmidium cellare TaxID=395010 RepID=A0ABR0F0L5_ZASCE|nr:hypothetical protein PRZ48_000626 [Zasmidium cellare]